MSVPGSAHSGRIVIDRVLFAVTLGSEPIRGDTSTNQPGHDGIGSFLRQLEILLGATDTVGITGNLQVDVRILLEKC
jgi:hypothetical protein